MRGPRDRSAFLDVGPDRLAPRLELPPVLLDDGGRVRGVSDFTAIEGGLPPRPGLAAVDWLFLADARFEEAYERRQPVHCALAATLGADERDLADAKNAKLTDEEKGDLVAFLRALDANYTIQEPALP